MLVTAPPTPTPAPTPTPPVPAHHRLTRVQQFTLTTWRWAFVAFCGQVGPADLLPQVALQAVLARLCACDDPLQLLARHASAAAEFALVADLLPEQRRQALAHDLVDSAFLLRWNELTADGSGPEELPPLPSRRTSSKTTDVRAAGAEDRPRLSLLDRLRAAWISGASPSSSRR
jgi:hypothetical protein